MVGRASQCVAPSAEVHVMLKKPSVRKGNGSGSAIGRHRLLRQTREVIVQRLNGRDARIHDDATGDLGEGLIRNTTGLGDLGPSAFCLIQTAKDGGKHWFLLYPHGNTSEEK